MPAPKPKTTIAKFTAGNVTLTAVVTGTAITSGDREDAKFGVKRLSEMIESVEPTSANSSS